MTSEFPPDQIDRQQRDTDMLWTMTRDYVLRSSFCFRRKRLYYLITLGIFEWHVWGNGSLSITYSLILTIRVQSKLDTSLRPRQIYSVNIPIAFQMSITPWSCLTLEYRWPPTRAVQDLPTLDARDVSPEPAEGHVNISAQG